VTYTLRIAGLIESANLIRQESFKAGLAELHPHPREAQQVAMVLRLEA
jgi:hypothetical protein